MLRVTPVLVAATTGLLTVSGSALAATTSSLSAKPQALPNIRHAAADVSYKDAVINPASTVAYLTVAAKNEVAVLNLTNDTFGTPIPVGSDPQGIDITPDGSTLYVADSGGRTISKVTIATRKVQTIVTPKTFLDDTPYSIAVLGNGNALYTTTFSGSGYGADVYKLSLSTHTSSVVKAMGTRGEVTEVTPLSRSANREVVGAVLGDDSGGPFNIYKAATGKVASGTLNEFITSGALNSTGTRMLVTGQAGTKVINGSGTDLGTIKKECKSVVLTASGSIGYCLTATRLFRLNVTRFLVGASVALPSGIKGVGGLTMSPNGKILLMDTSAGAATESI